MSHCFTAFGLHVLLVFYFLDRTSVLATFVTLMQKAGKRAYNLSQLNICFMILKVV